MNGPINESLMNQFDDQFNFTEEVYLKERKANKDELKRMMKNVPWSLLDLAIVGPVLLASIEHYINQNRMSLLPNVLSWQELVSDASFGWTLAGFLAAGFIASHLCYFGRIALAVDHYFRKEKYLRRRFERANNALIMVPFSQIEFGDYEQ